MSISNPYFVLDVPTIEDVRVHFQYRYFTRGETIHPGNQDPTNEPRTRKNFGLPRFLKFVVSHSLRELAVVLVVFSIVPCVMCPRPLAAHRFLLHHLRCQ